MSLIRQLLTQHLRSAPPLNLVESLQLGHGNKDNDGLLATTDIDLTGSRDLEGSEFSLEFGNVVFEVDQSLSDVDLSLVRGSGGRIGRAEDLVLDGHVES